ncbi:hypothetical protein CCACVL1_18619 [Corchorus capsularis]|uniref:Uncharacterized protein n=1 Tax=Corchorus capsularis TaxID=210143 RepID=A0A1R3HKH3_COCAP|nr:hypothetical protein CCACVL1_18619 [Corchorus capsularis]
MEVSFPNSRPYTATNATSVSVISSGHHISAFYFA